MKKTYYGVSQSTHGLEYRWIFEESVLSKEIYHGENIPDEDCIDCRFPIGGSNSSATWIQKLEDDEAIKSFLTAIADGPDSEDPALVDIGEYILAIDNDYNSCTDIFMKKFGFDYDKLEQFDDEAHHRKQVVTMFQKLKQCGYQGLDYNDPFCGANRDMRFSELCNIYESVVSKTPH